ncbi:hypothetical protein EAY46_24735 [Vibrio anguillarum]|uniref:Uncharacterized protein n=1 Tax=Vibrio anguillarum TaxID=55601 RepID=A0ABR9ZEP0_VIBAN|nr:hypothetical protein [Vibrio anguillarum]
MKVCADGAYDTKPFEGAGKSLFSGVFMIFQCWEVFIFGNVHDFSVVVLINIPKIINLIIRGY